MSSCYNCSTWQVRHSCLQVQLRTCSSLSADWPDQYSYWKSCCHVAYNREWYRLHQIQDVHVYLITVPNTCTWSLVCDTLWIHTIIIWWFDSCFATRKYYVPKRHARLILMEWNVPKRFVQSNQVYQYRLNFTICNKIGPKTSD